MFNHAISDVNDLIDLQRQTNAKLHQANVLLGGWPAEAAGEPVPEIRTDSLDGALMVLHNEVQSTWGMADRLTRLVLGADLDTPSVKTMAGADAMRSAGVVPRSQ